MEMGYFSTELQEQLNTLMLPILALIGLSFAVGIDPYVKKPIKRVLMIIDAAVLTIILANCLGNTLEAAWDPAYQMAQIALDVYCYIMRPVTIVLFIYIVWDGPGRRLFWIPVGLNAAIYLTAFFRPWSFSINGSDGLFYRGPLGYTAHFVSFALLFVLLAISLMQFRRINGFERLIPVVNVIIAALARCWIPDARRAAPSPSRKSARCSAACFSISGCICSSCGSTSRRWWQSSASRS